MISIVLKSNNKYLILSYNIKLHIIEKFFWKIDFSFTLFKNDTF